MTASAAAQTPGFWLTGAAPQTIYSRVRALSQDGSVAAGYSEGNSIPATAPGFTWTAGAGRSDSIGPGLPIQSPVFGLSSDASVSVGFMGDVGVPRRAYRRVGSGPLQDLGPFGTSVYASGVSGDGSIVVGHGESTIGGQPIGQAFRWTEQTGIQGLGTLHGGLSEANAISRDGSTIVGDSYAGATEAFVWRQGTGLQGLPPLPGGLTLGSYALGVNADGSVIVGEAMAPNGQVRAVRWTSTGIQDLGPGAAYAASDDGTVIGGAGAFVWTPGTGRVDLSIFLASHGVTIPTGWSPAYIYAISGDGRTFAGEAWTSAGAVQGFVASIPTPPTVSLVVTCAPLLARRRRRGAI